MCKPVPSAKKCSKYIKISPTLLQWPLIHGRIYAALKNRDVSAITSISAYAEQHKLLRELSEQSDCVIVGRCADYVLRDRNPFRIFIYADQASKIKRCMERKPAEEELSQREMKKKMAEIDRNRSKYYEFFSEQKWGIRANYDLLLNTTDKDIEKMASAVYAYVKEAFA